MPTETRNVQNPLERAVRVPRFARAILGVVVLAGGAFFILISLLLLWSQRHSGKSLTFNYGFVVACMLALAVGFSAIGIRLIRMRTTDEHLLGPNGLRACAYCAAVLGLFTVGTGLWSSSLYLVASGVFGIYAAFAIYRAAGRLHSKGTMPHEP